VVVWASPLGRGRVRADHRGGRAVGAEPDELGRGEAAAGLPGLIVSEPVPLAVEELVKVSSHW